MATKTPKKAPEYKASLKILGKTYKATGESVADVVAKLKPETSKAFGVLTISNGDKVREKVINSPILFRVFNGSPTSRSISMKHLSILFENI